MEANKEMLNEEGNAEVQSNQDLMENDNSAQLQEQVKKYARIIFALAVVVVGVFWYIQYSQETASEEETRASLELSRVMPYFTQQQFELALNGDPNKFVRGDQVNGLISIADQYSGTKQGSLAAYYAGMALFATDKAEEAVRYYEMGLNAESILVKSGSYAGIGAAKESLNDFQAAADAYKKAGEVNPASSSKYKYFEAVCLEKAGNKDAALKIYTEVSELREFNDYVKMAQAAVARLGMKIE